MRGSVPSGRGAPQGATIRHYLFRGRHGWFVSERGCAFNVLRNIRRRSVIHNHTAYVATPDTRACLLWAPITGHRQIATRRFHRALRERERRGRSL